MLVALVCVLRSYELGICKLMLFMHMVMRVSVNLWTICW